MSEHPPSSVVSVEFNTKKSFKVKFLLINFYVRIYSWTLRFVRFIVGVCASIWSGISVWANDKFVREA